MPKWLGLCSREERPPPFEYGTLQPNHIRILVLLPGTPSDPVQCSFSVVPRDEAPSIWFEALSYCWGPEPRVFEFITIDGKTKAVWPNLYGALLALRRENEARSLWIDAVCIDQASVAEKDDQVPSMALIYRAAACVVVWLGGSYEDSDYAMDTIRCGRRGAYTEERFIMAMLNLAGRPWFTRTWIVQEFVLNRASPQMVCGSQEPVGCEEFFGAFDVAVMELSRYSKSGFKDKDATVYPILVEKLMRRSIPVIMLGSTREFLIANSDVDIKYSLRYLLEIGRPFRATDPRDKVYGILALGNKAVQTANRPNYAKSVADVFTDAMLHLLRTEKAVDFYASTCVSWQSRNSSLPSWVPDLVPHQGAAMDDYSSIFDVQNPSSSSIEMEDIRLQGARTLVVRGLLLDEIDTIITPPSLDPTRHEHRVQPRDYPSLLLMWLAQWLHHLRSGGSGSLAWCLRVARLQVALFSSWLLWARALAEISDLARRAIARRRAQTGHRRRQRRSRTPAGGGMKTEEGEEEEEEEEPLWVTLMVKSSDDTGHDRESPAADSRLWALRWAAAMTTFAFLMAVATPAVLGPWVLWRDRRRPEIMKSMQEHNSVLMALQHAFRRGRCFFVGKRGGWYGLAEGRVRRGDVLALLFPRANVPFVLRREGGAYKMVGVARVPKKMQAEAVEDGVGDFQELRII